LLQNQIVPILQWKKFVKKDANLVNLDFRIMAKKGIVVRTFTITKKEADDFIDVIKQKLSEFDPEQLENIYLFDRSNHAIVLSIDSNWRPFIGFSRSYNMPNNRIHLSNEERVLSLAIDAMLEREYERSGGRIFISKHKVFHKHDSRGCTLCIFTWQGEDPYEVLLEFFNTL
jgi:hypothetical protein